MCMYVYKYMYVYIHIHTVRGSLGGRVEKKAAPVTKTVIRARRCESLIGQLIGTDGSYCNEGGEDQTWCSVSTI